MDKEFTGQHVVATDLQYIKFNRNSFSTIEDTIRNKQDVPGIHFFTHNVRRRNGDDDGLTIAIIIIIIITMTTAMMK
jgi:hypothetical protein